MQTTLGKLAGNKSKSPKAKLRTIEIHMADNGVDVTHRYGSGNDPYPSGPEKKFVFTSPTKLMSHLKEHVKPHFMDPDAEMEGSEPNDSAQEEKGE